MRPPHGVLDELDHYRWSGHAVLMGSRHLSGQETDSVLERFGNDPATARHTYRQFIADGVNQGHRDDLIGGGLKRSRGERPHEEYESFDARILGSGGFVESLRRDERP